MKKIFIFVVVISYFIFLSTPSAKIKRNGEDSDGKINIILTKTSNAVIIDNDLIVIKYSKDLEKILKKNGFLRFNNIYHLDRKEIKIYNQKSQYKHYFNYVVNNKTFCINYSHCNYVYALNNKIKANNIIETIIINQNIKLNLNTQEELYEEWIDIFNINYNKNVLVIITKDKFIKFIVGNLN